jgi:hypothetical protein
MLFGIGSTWTVSSMKLYKEKSKEIKSGDLGGHGIGTPQPIL